MPRLQGAQQGHLAPRSTGHAAPAATTARYRADRGSPPMASQPRVPEHAPRAPGQPPRPGASCRRSCAGSARTAARPPPAMRYRVRVRAATEPSPSLSGLSGAGEVRPCVRLAMQHCSTAHALSHFILHALIGAGKPGPHRAAKARDARHDLLQELPRGQRLRVAHVADVQRGVDQLPGPAALRRPHLPRPGPAGLSAPRARSMRREVTHPACRVMLAC